MAALSKGKLRARRPGQRPDGVFRNDTAISLLFRVTFRISAPMEVRPAAVSISARRSRPVSWHFPLKAHAALLA